ncbi:MAG: glycerophosphodiester phosphodiesterase [Megasphaera sp.]|jgi:glycerophosphoryl diester phosphodiesterase|nr:glycerophosphodiester phosphodiesterase [Megasphaera sp.]MCH4187383.1 glycerophosphodiester phosphodiesterase [Megasphaera sp.]MCH4217565.1 glycerophosphodiester phosphodiesterase [Megasphaera sp.]
MFVNKSWKKRVLAASVMAVLCMGAQALIAPQPIEAKADFSNTFDFEPHRGGRDARPENTLYSYAYAMEHGATSIECDMQLTKDGQIVMSHNPILNPDITRDKNGKYVQADKHDIRTMTVPEIKQYDVGVMNPDTEYYKLHGTTQVTHDAKIPTLDEVMQLIRDYGDKDVYLNIETKSYPDPAAGAAYKNNADAKKFVETFNTIVKKYDMENRVVLQSFDWNTLRLMKQLNPNISLSALWQEQPSWGRSSESLRAFEKEKSPWLGGLDIKDYKGNPVAAAHAIGADIISPYYPELSKQQVDEAHALGMKVVPWTVNDPKDMAMLYDMGVDGMISDKPWILRAFLEKRGAKLRQPVQNIANPYHLTPDHKTTAESKKVEGGLDAAY